MNDQLPEWKPEELPDLPGIDKAKPSRAAQKGKQAPATEASGPTPTPTVSPEPSAPAPAAPAPAAPSVPYVPQMPVKVGASTGTIIARVIGFTCLGIGLFVLISACSIINQINQTIHSYTEPTKDPRVAELAIKADGYLGAFTANESMIPDFANFQMTQANYGELPCPDGYSSPDTCTLGETAALSSRDDAKYCAEVIALAKELGATHDSVPNANSMEPLSSKSTDRCVATLSTYPRSVGWGWFSARYFLQGVDKNNTPFIIQLSLEQDSVVNMGTGTDSANTDPTKLETETWKYTITTSTGFDTENPISQIPDYSDGKIQAAAMLDTVAYYRRSNPKIDPFDGTFAKTMLKEYKQRFRFSGNVSAHADSDGTVHWVQFGAKDFNACISVGQLADLKAQSEDAMSDMLTSGLPGGTMELSGLGKEVSSISAKSKFGDYVLGTCH